MAPPAEYKHRSCNKGTVKCDIPLVMQRICVLSLNRILTEYDINIITLKIIRQSAWSHGCLIYR